MKQTKNKKNEKNIHEPKNKNLHETKINTKNNTIKKSMKPTKNKRKKTSRIMRNMLKRMRATRLPASLGGKHAESHSAQTQGGFFPTKDMQTPPQF